jgi:hypothetical protein
MRVKICLSSLLLLLLLCLFCCRHFKKLLTAEHPVVKALSPPAHRTILSLHLLCRVLSFTPEVPWIIFLFLLLVFRPCSLPFFNFLYFSLLILIKLLSHRGLRSSLSCFHTIQRDIFDTSLLSKCKITFFIHSYSDIYIFPKHSQCDTQIFITSCCIYIYIYITSECNKVP